MSNKNFNAYIAGADAFGTLHVSSGKIVACDPLADPRTEGFERSVPLGDFPVHLVFADDRPALAFIRFSEKDPVQWVMATTPGQDLSQLQPGYLYGYPVDAGMGCFMDEAAARLYMKREQDLNDEWKAAGKEGSPNLYDDLIDPAMQENDEMDFLDFQPYADQPHNVFFFTSGWGDGFYASYWGLDEDGNVAVLLTDFEIISDEDEEE